MADSISNGSPAASTSRVAATAAGGPASAAASTAAGLHLGGGGAGNTALNPLPAADRLFGWHDHAALWLSLGVGLLVMQVGSYLVPALGPRQALTMIVVGSILGAGLLAWTARIGCDSGLSSAGLMHATYGSSFARLPVVLNIVQLIGWTIFELVVMRDGTVAIAQQSGSFETPAWPIVATVFWGAALLALLSGSMVTLVRRFVRRFGLPLVIISLVWLTWQFLGRAQQQGLSAIGNRDGVADLVGCSRVNAGAVAIWILGVITYHACANLAPQSGAALPSLLLTFIAARLTRGPTQAAPGPRPQ